MNKCTRCGRVLAMRKTLIAIDGALYCGRACARMTLIDDEVDKSISEGLNRPYKESKAAADARYEECAEEVAMEDVLGEDLQDVQITLTLYKTVKVPKCLPKEKAEEAEEA